MKGREIALAVTALLVGAVVIVGVFLLVRRFQAVFAEVNVAPLDAGAPLEPVPLVPLEPEPDEEEDASLSDAQASSAKHASLTLLDAAAVTRGQDARAPHEAGFAGLKAAHIYIHPASNEQLCIDRRTGWHGYKLFPCASVRNQRWILEEDPSGIIHIQGGETDCIQVGEKVGSEYVLVQGACDGTRARFRHEDKRFREIETNRCLSVHSIAKKAQIFVSPCDPSSQAQMWGRGR